MDAREEREKRLKRLRRKRMATVAVFCLILAGLGCGYAAARRYRIKKATEAAEKKQEETKNNTFVVTEFTLVDATAMELINENGTFCFEWEYIKEEEHIGGWVKTDERDFPTKATAVQGAIGSVCLLKGSVKIPAEEVDPEKFGLADSKMRIKVFLKDGTEPVFTFGAQAPYEAGYYLRQESTGDVYLVDNDVFTKCHLTICDFAMSEIFPTTQPGNITEVTVAVKGKEPRSYTRTVNEDGTTSYPSIFVDCTTFVASTFVEYNCKDFAKYGLEEPFATVRVYYNDIQKDEETGENAMVPCQMFVEFGNKTESGNYYVRVNGSNYVYIMTESFADLLLVEK